MIRNPHTRRILSLVLLLMGGLLLFLVAEDIWIGGVLLLLGVALEIAGTLMHRRGDGRQ